MLTALIGRIVIILFGVLHPSYKTYKAISRKDPKDVVILGMYWVVFSIFTTVELVTDIFLAWIPFYYELKIIFVIWLVTPATSGYSLIYRKLIHPELSKRESEIDEYITTATEKGYTKFVEIGAKGLNYAARTVISTAIMGQGMLADRLSQRSVSMNDLRLTPSEIARCRTGMGSGDSHEYSRSLKGYSRGDTNWSNSHSHRWKPLSEDSQESTDLPTSLQWLREQAPRRRPIPQDALEEVSESINEEQSNAQPGHASGELPPKLQPLKTGRTQKKPSGLIQKYLRLVSTNQPVGTPTPRAYYQSLELPQSSPSSPSSPCLSRRESLPTRPMGVRDPPAPIGGGGGLGTDAGVALPLPR